MSANYSPLNNWVAHMGAFQNCIPVSFHQCSLQNPKIPMPCTEKPPKTPESHEASTQMSMSIIYIYISLNFLYMFPIWFHICQIVSQIFPYVPTPKKNDHLDDPLRNLQVFRCHGPLPWSRDVLQPWPRCCWSCGRSWDDHLENDVNRYI